MQRSRPCLNRRPARINLRRFRRLSSNATAKVIISNRLGLHARPAMSFVETACNFKSDVVVRRQDQKVDGKSIMQMMMLAATKGTELLIEATGPDADETIQALIDLVNRGFDEE